MGTLTNLNGITEPQIPAAIARDTEVASAIASHVSAVDPHPTYLTQPEGDGRYRQTATPLVDGDIPAVIARDTEVANAIASHVAAPDPHPTYLTQPEGDGRYRQTATPLVDGDIPAAIARDAEVASAIASHVAAPDPHPIYLSQADFTSFGNIDNQSSAFNVLAGGSTHAERLTNGAFIAFHRPGIAANYFGLSTFNDLRFGGWSNHGSSWRVWHEGQGIPVWQAPSDSRLKKKIRPIKSAVDILMEAKPISFEYSNLIGQWGESEYTRRKIHYGFKAEDFPLQDLVGIKENGYLGLDYLEIVPFLVRAIQELQDQINILKNTE